MSEINRCPISGDTREEEWVSHVTHMMGLFLSIAGSIFLVTQASLYGDSWNILSAVVYGSSLVLLYMASTIYHGSQTTKGKSLLQIVDHSCIYFLIAGSYTPFILGPLRNSDQMPILYFEWAFAIFGTVFKFFAIGRYEYIALIAYLAMGWLAVLMWPALVSELSFKTLFMLALGGIFYSLGTIFFLWDSLHMNHAIWHLFVLSGSVCHFFAIYEVISVHPIPIA